MAPDLHQNLTFVSFAGSGGGLNMIPCPPINRKHLFILMKISWLNTGYPGMDRLSKITGLIMQIMQQVLNICRTQI